MDRHLGRFVITNEMIDTTPDIVRQIMGNCIITRAECMFHWNGISYVAISPKFRYVPFGSIAPKYKIVVVEDNVDPIMFIEEEKEKENDS